MNKLIITSALALVLATPAFAQDNQDCGNAAACHYNDASITKGDTDNSQDVGDHLNNTYAPDSATSTATGGSVGDVIAQGGTGGSAEASGNTSTNDNRSNANIGANSQSNTGNNNTNTGGNYSQGDMVGGGFHQGDQIGGGFSQGPQIGGSIGDTVGGNATGGQVGDTIGGNAQGGAATGGNVTGGTATTNAGEIDNHSSVRGSGNSRNQNVANGGRQGQQQGQAQRQNSRSQARASGGNSRNANSQANAQRTTVNANTRIRHSAASAYAAQLNGYGPNNCFGDTNPSGSFTAGMQTFGWGVTAARSKASNVCALMAVGGQRAAAAYLAAQDPNAHRALVAAGIVTTPSRVKAARDAEIATTAQPVASMPYTICEIRDGALYIRARAGRKDEAVTACMAKLGQRPAISTAIEPSPICPAGSHWDGHGCWMPRR